MTPTLLAGLAAFALALVTTALLVPLVRRVAVARDFVDRPGGHKGHTGATPLGGGVAVVVGMLLPMLAGALIVARLAGQSSPPDWLPPELAAHLPGAAGKLAQLGVISGCLVVVAALGLVDDRRGLSPWLRLGVHLAAGAVLWFADVRVTLFVASPTLSLVMTSLWIAGITSAFNMLDNMDGLSSGVAVIVALVLAGALATPTSQLFVIALLLCIAGAGLGFWLHNRPPASIFMGDAGSTALGFMLGVATTLATFYGEAGRTQVHAVAIPLLVMAIPLYDMASVVTLRLARGVSPFSADRHHFSHRLMRLGLTRWATLSTIYLATLTTGLGALVVDAVPLSGAMILLAQGALVLGIIATLEIAAAWQRGERDAG